MNDVLELGATIFDDLKVGELFKLSNGKIYMKVEQVRKGWSVELASGEFVTLDRSCVVNIVKSVSIHPNKS